VTGSLALPQLVAANARRAPDGLAITSVDGDRWTWAQLDDAGRRWCAGLRSLGVRAGDLVVTMLPNNAAGALGWLGPAAAGAVEVPINHAYLGSWLLHVLTNTAAKVAIVDARFWAQWEPVLAGSPIESIVVVGGAVPTGPPGIRVIGVDDWLAAVEPATGIADPTPLDIACIVYTSGTTGASKGVLVPWRQWDARYRSAYIPAEFRTADQVCYSTMGPFHVTSKIPLYDAARQGSMLCTREGWKTEHFLTDVRAHGCTYTIMVGTMAHFLRAEPVRDDDAETPLRLISMAPLFPGIEAFGVRFGVRIVTAYSMTELPMVFYSNTFYAVSEETYRWCGNPDPAFGVRLLAEDGSEAAVGAPGELAVAAEPGVITPGYLDMPEATAACWHEGWFHTGDMFVRDASGRYAFVDRKKDAIRRRGENISSFEIEAAVNAHAAVLESAAYAVPSEFGEDDVKVALVLQQGATLDPAALIAFLEARMPRFAIPRYVEVLEALPKTPTQRVRKAELRAAGITAATWDRDAGRRRSPVLDSSGE
jgi:crotonobetaine/carnitine-CoA ligase